MFYNLTFRAKIFFSQVILFIVFFAVLTPFVENTAAEIVQRAFIDETKDVIAVLKPAVNEQEMIELINKEKTFLYMRLSLYNADGKEVAEGSDQEEGAVVTSSIENSVVNEALQKGYSYQEGFPRGYRGRFVFIAVAFVSHEKRYVICTSYPYWQIEKMLQNFEKSYLALGSIILLFFMFMTWLVFARLSQPIKQIIQTIIPYQEGKTDELPIITLSSKVEEGDEMQKLADTLNSLSGRVKAQVQRIREERNEKEAILESLGEGVMAVDATLCIQYVNFIAAKMLGLSRKQLIGTPLLSIEEKAKQILIERCCQLLVSCQQQKVVMTDSVSLGDARKLYLDLIAAPKADERGAIIVMQDNSNHYRILEMGKDFVANASHELRTPITIIRGFAETLQDLPEISAEMLHDITDKILRSCHRMDHLIKSLLVLADIENLPLANLQNYNLGQLIEECREHLLSVKPDARVEIIIHGEQPIMALVVADLFELALFNLLENAVKYSASPAYITIVLQKQEDTISISVTDRGMGIPEADLDQIFSRFYTVNKAHSRKLGGAGLGLSIVKTIIEKHDGSISAVSEIGKGSCFTILLPAQHL
ncbi:MAG: PAS domain-containing protein [Simkania sp.]|nr:PAS domain-containing protein [Simkania sp.]